MLQVGWGDVMEVGMEGCVCPEGPALHVAQVLPSSEQVARLLVLCLLLDVVC